MSKKGEEGSNEIPDSHKELATLAINEFNKGNYPSSTLLLSKVLHHRPKDLKALMNKAVVEYYKSGLKKTSQFRKSLTDICYQAGIKIDNCSSSSVEAIIIRFNYCLVLFHLQEFDEAVVILEKMHKNLDSIDEKVGISMSMLLVECYLQMKKPAKALAIVDKTESFFLPPPHEPEKTNEESRDLNKCSSGQNIPVQNMASANESIPEANETKDSADQELLRTKLLILRVRSNLQLRLQRQYKKDLRSFTASPDNSQNPSLLMIKALAEHLKNSQHKKAMKFLNMCANLNSSTYSPRISVSYYNNLGVLFYFMSKPTLSIMLIRNSLIAMKSESANEVEAELPGICTNETADLISINYNMGLVLLSNNQPVEGFDYLLLVVRCHPSNPKIWLRLAECCIGAHKQSVKLGQKQMKHCIRFLYTTSDGRKVISISSNVDNHDKHLIDQQQITDAALPIPTLEFARICLRNAMYLIPDDISLDVVPEDQENSYSFNTHDAPPSVALRGWHLMQIKLASLAASAYVCLCLGDCAVSLRYAQTLISLLPKVPRLEADYKFLAHMYCGEALVKLGRISEAISFFDPLQVGEMNLPQAQEVSELTSDKTDFNTYACYGGNIILRYNLAAANAIRGQYTVANNLLRKISNEIKEWPAQFYMLSLYINLQLGNMDAVETIIKNRCYS